MKDGNQFDQPKKNERTHWMVLNSQFSIGCRGQNLVSLCGRGSTVLKSNKRSQCHAQVAFTHLS